MSERQRVIGFDAREMWLEEQIVWSQRRRDDFLYRSDATKPLSVDDLVWFSVFGAGAFASMLPWTGQATPQLGSGAATLEYSEEPEWSVQELWADLQLLRRRLAQRSVALPGPYWIIGVTLLLEGLSPEQERAWDARLLPVSPGSIDPAWEFLGYDVADFFLLSGLANCGFVPEVEDVEELRRKWGSHLNEFHLFTSKREALRFGSLADARVPDHAPFFVFGLWRIATV